MSETRVKFSRLRQLFADAGFREVSVSANHLGFQHDPSETLIILPDYGLNANVASHHPAQMRVMLDAKGLVDGQAFERRLAEVPARHPASN